MTQYFRLFNLILVEKTKNFEDIDYTTEKLFKILKNIVGEFPDHILLLLAQFSGVFQKKSKI